jgi:hypothetical protein
MAWGSEQTPDPENLRPLKVRRLDERIERESRQRLLVFLPASIKRLT